MNKTSTIVIFLVIKILQLLNINILTHLFETEVGIILFRDIFVFISFIFLLGILVRKFAPKALGRISLGILGFVIIGPILCGWVSVPWPSWLSPLVMLIGLYLYALIGIEGQIVQTLTRYKNIPHIVLLLLTLLPVIVYYPSDFGTSQLFYLYSSILAFITSFSAKQYGYGKIIYYSETPPFWLGVLFLLGSSFIYYHGIYRSQETPIDNIYPFFVSLFYIGGMLVIYMAIEDRLQRVLLKEAENKNTATNQQLETPLRP